MSNPKIMQSVHVAHINTAFSNSKHFHYSFLDWHLLTIHEFIWFYEEKGQAFPGFDSGATCIQSENYTTRSIGLGVY